MEMEIQYTPWPDAFHCILLDTEHPGAFPSEHIHIHKPAVCHPKQAAVCTSCDKKKRGKLVPAGEHSLYSTQEDKSKQKSMSDLPCLLGLVFWTRHKGTRGTDQGRRPPQEQPRGRRNLLLHSQISFRGEKCSNDERLHWRNHSLGPIMPHDVRRHLDHVLL